MYMDSLQGKPKKNMRVLALAIFLIAWPAIVLFVSLNSIYALVGAPTENNLVDSTLDLAQMSMTAAFYIGPVSILAGIVLLVLIRLQRISTNTKKTTILDVVSSVSSRNDVSSRIISKRQIQKHLKK